MVQFLPFIIFCISTSITPGPNNLMIMNSGLKFGLSRSLPHYFGICFGFALMVFLVSFGVGEVFLRFTWLKSIMSVLGSIYMLYLAYQLYSSNDKGTGKLVEKPWPLMKAIGFQWLNPKAWLMALGAIMVFSMSKNPLLNALYMSGVFFLAASPCIGVWLMFGHYLKKIITSDKHRRLFNHVMALGLIISIVLIWI